MLAAVLGCARTTRQLPTQLGPEGESQGAMRPLPHELCQSRPPLDRKPFAPEACRFFSSFPLWRTSKMISCKSPVSFPFAQCASPRSSSLSARSNGRACLVASGGELVERWASISGGATTSSLTDQPLRSQTRPIAYRPTPSLTDQPLWWQASDAFALDAGHRVLCSLVAIFTLGAWSRNSVIPLLSPHLSALLSVPLSSTSCPF